MNNYSNYNTWAYIYLFRSGNVYITRILSVCGVAASRLGPFGCEQTGVWLPLIAVLHLSNWMSDYSK